MGPYHSIIKGQHLLPFNSNYSKTCLKGPLKHGQNKNLNEKW